MYRAILPLGEQRMEDLSDIEPLTITKRAEDTDGAYFQADIIFHPSSDSSNPTTHSLHRRWLVDNDAEHLHPHQAESFVVQSGEFQVDIEGTVHSLAEGDDITIPPNTVHHHWNPSDRPAWIRVERSPARHTDALLETMYVLSQTNRTNARGFPNLLQLAVLQHAHAGDSYTPNLPIVVQKALSFILAPIGRLVGYKTHYTFDEIPADS